jgi:hypothetical protein
LCGPQTRDKEGDVQHLPSGDQGDHAEIWANLAAELLFAPGEVISKFYI